jgi:hypothetical protein
MRLHAPAGYVELGEFAVLRDRVQVVPKGVARDEIGLALRVEYLQALEHRFVPSPRLQEAGDLCVGDEGDDAGKRCHVVAEEVLRHNEQVIRILRMMSRSFPAPVVTYACKSSISDAARPRQASSRSHGMIFMPDARWSPS